MSQQTQLDVGYGRTTDLAFDDAVARIEKTLADEGFGVLSRIDVKATMKKKIDVEMPNYLILGSCNPNMAHKALSADGEVGLMLPCNVVVRDVEGRTRIEAINAELFSTIFAASEIAEVGKQVNEMLRRAVDRATE